MPLLVDEQATRVAVTTLQDDPEMLVWWATEVECVGAIARREREGASEPLEAAAAVDALAELASLWREVPTSDNVRRDAIRLLRVHPLRAADALQLAAALTGSEGHPRTLEVVTLDERVADAARREGFKVLP